MNALQKNQRPFCAVPWLHLYVGPSGVIRICCYGEKEGSALRKPDGSEFSIFDLNDIRTVFESEHARDIRQKMRKGERVPICKLCIQEESHGLLSMRERLNARYAKQLSAIVREGNEPKSDVPRIQKLDLRLGNTCNLKCRMCNPEASKKWINEWNLIPSHRKISSIQRKKFSSITWQDDPKAWKNIFPLLDGLQEISLAGGEPMLIGAQEILLKECVETGAAEHIDLKYISNCTVFPEHLVEYWKSFRSVQIKLSIDAFGELNEYIRYPSKWPQVENILFKFSNLAKAETNIHIKIICTVSALNVSKLVDLLEFTKGFHPNLPAIPYFNLLTEPSYLSVNVLPAAILDLAKSKLCKWIEKNEDFSRDKNLLYDYERLVQLNSYLNHQKHSESNTFVENLRILDNLRGQSFSEANSDFVSLI